MVLNWTAEYQDPVNGNDWKDVVLRVNGEEVWRQGYVWTRHRDASDEPQVDDVMDMLRDFIRWMASR